MRLLIISHTPHYVLDGAIVGWGATIREIDELATLFDSVTHIAPLYSEAAPASAMPYRSPRVHLHAVRPAGGERLYDKIGILLRYPSYVWAILKERRVADVIHVRAPANISMLALVLLSLMCRPKIRWVKYAGDWSRSIGEPWAYRFQRWWLARGFHRGVVTVNGHWQRQPVHVHSFMNPCLTDAELTEGSAAGQRKALCQPLRLLFVGRLEAAKGVGICLEVMAQLEKSGLTAELDLIGEGEERQQFEEYAGELKVAGRVKFHGGVPRDALSRFYERAHFILLPSDSEGWPKVLSEAMAYGVVPVASSVGSIPEYLANFSTGSAVRLRNSRLFSDAVIAYVRTPANWDRDSQNALNAARQFSYGKYLHAVRDLLKPLNLGFMA